jgi:hypothetical protein
MSESDVVSQHETRLKKEVAAHMDTKSGQMRAETSIRAFQQSTPSKEIKGAQKLGPDIAAPVARKSKKLPAVSLSTIKRWFYACAAITLLI